MKKEKVNKDGVLIEVSTMDINEYREYVTNQLSFLHKESDKAIIEMVVIYKVREFLKEYGPDGFKKVVTNYMIESDEFFKDL